MHLCIMLYTYWTPLHRAILLPHSILNSAQQPSILLSLFLVRNKRQHVYSRLQRQTDFGPRYVQLAPDEADENR